MDNHDTDNPQGKVITFAKTCVRCGETKPAEEFHRSAKNADGLQSYCKQCQAETARQKSATIRLSKSRRPCNPDLAAFQPRHLIEELRARGYYGELKYIQVIKV